MTAATSVTTAVAPVRRVHRPAPVARGTKKKKNVKLSAAAIKHQQQMETFESMTQITCPLSFAYKHIWGRPSDDADTHGPAVTAEDSTKKAYIQRCHDDAVNAINFWFSTFPVALHIALAWQGESHMTKNIDEDGPNKGRSRWHLMACAAAIEMGTLGEARMHDFVMQVWDITMRQRKVDKRIWNWRTGTPSKDFPLHDEANRPSKTAWAQWASDTCLRAYPLQDRNRVSVENVFGDKSKANAASTYSRFVASTREWIRDMMYSGTLKKVTPPWTRETVLGSDCGHGHGPWWPDEQADSIGRGLKSGAAYVPNLHSSQAEFLRGDSFVVFDPGNTVLARGDACIRTYIRCNFVSECNIGTHQVTL